MFGHFQRCIFIICGYTKCSSFEKRHMFYYGGYSLPWKPSLFSSDVSDSDVSDVKYLDSISSAPPQCISGGKQKCISELTEKFNSIKFNKIDGLGYWKVDNIYVLYL